MSLVEQWMNSKSKTYWRCWECVGTDYAPGTWQWVLFYTEDDNNPKATYDSGLCGSEDECKKEIKETIAHRIKNSVL